MTLSPAISSKTLCTLIPTNGIILIKPHDGGGGGWGEGGVYVLRTCGDLLGRDRCDPRCLSSPAHKEARSKKPTAALFFPSPSSSSSTFPSSSRRRS